MFTGILTRQVRRVCRGGPVVGAETFVDGFRRTGDLPRITTEDDVIALCRGYIAGYERPRYVVFVDELPRNASGETVERSLRLRYAHLGAPE